MRHIDLPPVESLALRAWIVMMVVMPPLTKSYQSEEPVVLAVIARWKSALADQVREGIDAKSSVI